MSIYVMCQDVLPFQLEYSCTVTSLRCLLLVTPPDQYASTWHAAGNTSLTCRQITIPHPFEASFAGKQAYLVQVDQTCAAPEVAVHNLEVGQLRQYA